MCRTELVLFVLVRRLVWLAIPIYLVKAFKDKKTSYYGNFIPHHVYTDQFCIFAMF